MENIKELEDIFWRNNARTDGIRETLSETWKNCKKKVTKNIKNKLDITDDIEIDRCHRLGKFQRNKSKLKTVVCKLLGFKDKHKVSQNVKKHRNLHLWTFF